MAGLLFANPERRGSVQKERTRLTGWDLLRRALCIRAFLAEIAWRLQRDERSHMDMVLVADFTPPIWAAEVRLYYS